MGLISRKLLHRRPLELGKIKIGGKGKEITSKKGNKFQPPVKYDHFVVTSRVRGADGNFAKDAIIHGHPQVGDKPTALQGVLMFDRPDENLHTEMVVYKGRGTDGKVSSCDGETITTIANGKKGPCHMLSGAECTCKPYSRLHIQLWASPNTLGYHVLRSTGWETANNLQTALEEIYERFGTCYLAPVRLVVYPSEDAHEEGNSTSYKVGLVLAMGLAEAGQLMAKTRAQIEGSRDSLKLLAAGVAEDLKSRDDEERDDIHEIVQNGTPAPQAPSGPQAVSTAKGEPTSAPVAKAKPLPVAGEVKAPKEKATQEEGNVQTNPGDEPFDRDQARRRFFATLRAFGVANSQRKAWCKENEFAESTSDWKFQDFERAQELMVGPTRESVLALCEEHGIELAAISLDVLKMDAPEFLEHWQKLEAAIEASVSETDGDV